MDSIQTHGKSGDESASQSHAAISEISNDKSVEITAESGPPTSRKDKFKKKSYLPQLQMTAFFKREPGPSSVSSPNSSQRFSSSGEIREKWKDPQKKKNAQRQKHLRLLRKSDTQTRKTRFITNLVATQTDADFTSQQGKAEVVSKNISLLETVKRKGNSLWLMKKGTRERHKLLDSLHCSAVKSMGHIEGSCQAMKN